MAGKKKNKKTLPVPANLFSEDEAPKKRGRPKKAAAAAAEAPKKRGRPKGSKNKAKASAAQESAPKRRGRPPGSKNKAKAEVVAEVSPKRRPGRPKKSAVAKVGSNGHGGGVVITFDSDATLGEVTDFLAALKSTKLVKSVSGQLFGAH